MSRGQKYSAGQVYEMIERYFHMKRALGLHIESLEVNDGMTANYDEVGMPKGKGGISDPTFKQAFAVNTILSERMAKQYREYIAYVDELSPRITKIREQSVLHWRLSGARTKYIAEIEGITERHVRRILNDIAEKMSEMSVLSDVS